MMRVIPNYQTLLNCAQAERAVVTRMIADAWHVFFIAADGRTSAASDRDNFFIAWETREQAETWLKEQRADLI
jgi:hypothetical protein